MEKELVCKECGAPRDIGRRLCRQCNRIRLLKKARSTPRYMWNNLLQRSLQMIISKIVGKTL